MGAQGRLCALVLCALVGACGIHGHAPRWPVGRPLLRAARMPRMMGTRFERVLLDKLSAVGSETSMRTIFQQVDDEGSGKISSQDLYDALKQLNLNLTRRDVDRAIYRFDQKGDGSLNYAEFVRMLEDLLQIPHDEVLVRTGALAQARRYTTSSLWLHALLTMHKSSLLRHIVQPVAATATWSALLVGLSRVGWLTPNGPLSLLLWPKIHTLLGGALGLLLVFRTNSAYARMWEACARAPAARARALRGRGGGCDRPAKRPRPPSPRRAARSGSASTTSRAISRGSARCTRATLAG